MFEHPQALWLLALAAPIVLLHLHLARRRTIDVTSIELWRDLVPGRGGRGGFRRLRDAVALLFLLAALVGFSAAAAGPVTGAAASEPHRLAIVIDASATMGATSGAGPQTRFLEAIDRARDALLRLAPQDEVAIWLATSPPRVVLEPTRGRQIPVRELLEATPLLEPRNLRATVPLALRAAPGLAGRPASVLVLTDSPGAQSLDDLPERDRIEVGVVSRDGTARNTGIVAFDLDPADPTKLLLRAATTDGPTAPRELVLLRDGAEIARAPLAFDADGAASAVLTSVAGTGGTFEARLLPGDDFVEDDAARLVLPRTRALAVAVVAEKPSPFLVEALRAMPELVDPARTTLVAPGAPLPEADVVVADGVPAPAGKPSLSFLADGARVAEKPLLWSVGTHPVLAGVDLARLRIARAVVLETAGESAIIATAQGPVGIAGGDGDARHVVLGFRPDASTLPLEAAFPLVVRNALRWLGTPRAPPRYVVAGEPFADGDGALAPFPIAGNHAVRTPSGEETVIRWIAPKAFRLAPGETVSAPSATAVVASLPDRHLDRDTRIRYVAWCAAFGAAALVAGALLLGAARELRPPRREDLAASLPRASILESPAAETSRSR